MVDFLFGAEGQSVLEKFKYGSASKDYGFKKWYFTAGLSADQLERQVDSVGKARAVNHQEGRVGLVAVSAYRCVKSAYVPANRRWSTISQRSCTTLMPALAKISAAASLRMPD